MTKMVCDIYIKGDTTSLSCAGKDEDGNLVRLESDIKSKNFSEFVEEMWRMIESKRIVYCAKKLGEDELECVVIDPESGEINKLKYNIKDLGKEGMRIHVEELDKP